MNPLEIEADRLPSRLGTPAREPTAATREEPLDAATLYRRYRDEVFRYVSRRVTRREEVEDITAEVFASAASAPKFRRGYDPRLWLLGIARRKVCDTLRRRKRRPETLASELSEAGTHEPAANAAGEPEAELLRAESVRAVRELVAGLKEEQREALLLQYVEGLSIAEIAVVMGRSTGAVNSLLQRARAALYRRGQSYFLESEVGR